MQLNHSLVGIAALSLSASAQAQPELVIHINATDTVLIDGESTEYQIWGELLNPTNVIIATISDFGFDLSFGGTGLVITDNNFAAAFDSDFFGPAIDGVVAGDSIIGAVGANTLPPLANAGGVDSSNPLFIYSFTVDGTGLGTAAYTPVLTLNGSISGAYAGVPFVDVFFYQNADGSPGSVPFSIQADTIAYIPAPAGVALFSASALAAFRRRRRAVD